MKLVEVELRRVRLPLVAPFRTSFGTQTARDALLVRVAGPDSEGWGECVAMEEPLYSSEYVDGAEHVIRHHLLPRLFSAGDVSAPRMAGLLAPVKEHRMAKSAVETAVLDAELRASGVSPGWDVAPVAAVRERFGDVLLQVDANCAYSLADASRLARLDDLDLLLIEQPLPEDDLPGHAALAQRIRTPICLDESITSARAAAFAINLGACAIVNIKPGRVGGYLEARRVHDVCTAHGVPVWCGGMLETGIGRAANVALAALPGFTLPGDTSASDRYFRTDVTPPFVLQEGRLAVPTGPGIGVSPTSEALDELTVSTERITAA